MTVPERTAGDWGAGNTQTFVDLGRYVVPERELQLAMFAQLIPPRDTPFEIVELCCGEGLLAEQLLARHPQSRLYAYDGSPGMLAHARGRLAALGDRFQTEQFDLAAAEWRSRPPVWAVVSSLAIHHLDDRQKLQLFRDVYAMLEPGGVFVMADLVRAADERATQLAADAWDAAVARRGQELDGEPHRALAAFERERWNMYRYPDEGEDAIDRPSLLVDQLNWLVQAGFGAVDVYWMQAGHALFGGRRQ
jgi:trans-aconitate methyltransferase